MYKMSNIKVYKNVKTLKKDVLLLIDNGDIFTVEPVINIDIECVEAEA